MLSPLLFCHCILPPKIGKRLKRIEGILNSLEYSHIDQSLNETKSENEVPEVPLLGTGEQLYFLPQILQSHPASESEPSTSKTSNYNTTILIKRYYIQFF